MSGHQHATLEDTVFFWFGANDTSGSGGDGATPLFDVREAGAAADATPLLSGTPTLLSHANYPAGCYEIAVAATDGNGFAVDDTFAVYCTLAIDSENPTGFVGSCTLTPLATSEQVSGIVNTGAAINVLAIAAPNGFTLTTGSEVNDEDDTHALDGTRHELSDDAGTLDGVYKFNIGGDSAPVGLTFTGVFNSANDSWAISANAGTDGTPVWQQVGTISGAGGAGDTVHPFDLFSDQIVSDLSGIVQIRVHGTGLTSSSFDVDQVFVSKSDTSRSVGYEGGAVWIDGGSNSGIEPFVDGVADNASDNIATARVIADSIGQGLKVFHILPMVTVTLEETYNSFEFIGVGWILDLSGEDVNNSHFFNATVSGIGTASTLMGFHFCTIGTASLQKSRCTDSSFTGTVTMTLAGDYRFINCQSGVAGAGTPTFTKTAGQTITAEFRRWSGSLTQSGIEAGDVFTISGDTLGNIILNGAEGTVKIVGIYESITDNRTGSPTLIIDGAVKGSDVADILADTGTDGVVIAPAQGPIVFTGVSDEAGITLVGEGSGAGFEMTGGATGEGLLATGGATSGAGIKAIADGGGSGVHFAGIGANAGLRADGGATGAGGHFHGGATSGPGLNAHAHGNNDDALVLTPHGTGDSQTDLAAIAAAATEARLAQLDPANMPADVANTLIDTGTTLPGILGTPAGADMTADIAGVKADTTIPQRNQAFSNIPIIMVDDTDHVSPKTGLTVTGARSIDGGAEAAVSGSIAEVSNGRYSFDALAADMNGATINFRFSSAGADDAFLTVITRPV